ncbi:MAG: thioesterase family protein [Kiloniellaceae bacterium]
MTTPAPLELHREAVRREWIDYNGHMNVAYYVVAFDHACDAFLEYIGLDEAYRERCGGTTFTAECHVTYQRELREGDPLRFATQLFGFDAKRIHYFLQMYHAEEGFLAATSEWLSLYIDLDTRRVSPMPADITARLAEIQAAHRNLPRPPEAGRVIRVPPEKPV